MNKTDRESCINTIKSIRRLALNINGCIDVVDDQNCDKMIEFLESEPHWISCKKELPKLDSRCVLLYSNYNISGGYYRGNRTFDVDYGDEDVNTMVIAWMPEPIREVTE